MKEGRWGGGKVKGVLVKAATARVLQGRDGATKGREGKQWRYEYRDEGMVG